MIPGYGMGNALDLNVQDKQGGCAARAAAARRWRGGSRPCGAAPSARGPAARG